MKYFITGGAGFIGSHLVDRLMAEGNEVTVYDNLSSGRKEWIEPHFNKTGFQFVQADLLDDRFAEDRQQGVRISIVAIPDKVETVPLVLGIERHQVLFLGNQVLLLQIGVVVPGAHQPESTFSL